MACAAPVMGKVNCEKSKGVGVYIGTDRVWNQPPRISAIPLERLMRETTVSQKIISILPEHIPLHTYSQNEAKEAVSRISQAADRYGKAYLGFAVKRTSKGYIDSLALATSREVVIITSKASPVSIDQLLINLLAGSTSDQINRLTLVAFGMARIAIQLSWALNSPVVGIDLSTCFEGETRGPSRPSRLLSRVSSVVETWKVDALWATSCDTEASGETLCVRAWITAWCAIFLLLYEDDLNPRGNFQYRRDPWRRCDAEQSVDRLDTILR